MQVVETFEGLANRFAAGQLLVLPYKRGSTSNVNTALIRLLQGPISRVLLIDPPYDLRVKDRYTAVYLQRTETPEPNIDILYIDEETSLPRIQVDVSASKLNAAFHIVGYSKQRTTADLKTEFDRLDESYQHVLLANHVQGLLRSYHDPEDRGEIQKKAMSWAGSELVSQEFDQNKFFDTLNITYRIQAMLRQDVPVPSTKEYSIRLLETNSFSNGWRIVVDADGVDANLVLLQDVIGTIHAIGEKHKVEVFRQPVTVFFAVLVAKMKTNGNTVGVSDVLKWQEEFTNRGTEEHKQQMITEVLHVLESSVSQQHQ